MRNPAYHAALVSYRMDSRDGTDNHINDLRVFTSSDITTVNYVRVKNTVHWQYYNTCIKFGFIHTEWLTKADLSFQTLILHILLCAKFNIFQLSETSELPSRNYDLEVEN